MENKLTINITADQKLYLNRMASHLNFNLTEAREKQLAQATSQNDMNKIIFENLDKWQKETQQLDQSYAEKPYLKTQFKAQKTKLIAEINNAIDEYNTSIRSRINDLHNLFSYRAKRMTDLYAVEGKEDINILEQLNEVLKDTYFELDDSRSMTNNMLVFITKDTYLSYVNEQAKVRIENVNLGRFLVYCDLSNGSIKVQKYSKNISVDEHYHPHINKDGKVCWGNAAEIVNNAFKSFNIVPLMQALKVVLTTYNIESPYRSLEKFDIVANPARYPLEYSFRGASVMYRDDYYFNEEDSDLNGCFLFNLKNIHPDSIREICIDDTTFKSLEEALKVYTYDELISNLYYVTFAYYKATKQGNVIQSNLIKTIKGEYVYQYDTFIHMETEQEIESSINQ